MATHAVTNKNEPLAKLHQNQVNGLEKDAENRDIPAKEAGTMRSKLDILATVKEAQAGNGLKHGDYARYRQYCSRRVHRIRRAIKMTHGRGRYVGRKVPVELAATEPRALLIVLVLAERSWSHAMETKSGPVASPARGRRVILRKLTKAVKYAQLLQELCCDAAEQRTALEAEAYAAWMAANLKLERAEWPNALQLFQTSSKIYASMSTALAHTRESQLFQERVEEIEPSIRFCKYHISRTSGSSESESILRDLAGAGVDSGDILNEKIDAALAEARKKAAQSFGEIQWCGRTVPLRSEKVREEVLKATEESEALRKLDPRELTVDVYDKVFMAYNDAARTVMHELNEYRSVTPKTAGERSQELESLAAYLTYGRLSHTVERNLLLVQSFKAKRSSKQEDFVRLYDNLVHNMTDILSLTGVSNNAEISVVSERKRNTFLAHRCFHLAQCYASTGKPAEATALFNRVFYYANKTGDKADSSLDEIVKVSRGMKSRSQARKFLEGNALANSVDALKLAEAADGGKQGCSLMVENLDEFVPFAGPSSQNRRICNFPPSLEAVPCKPVYFDLAIDCITFPVERKSVEDVSRKGLAENAEPKEEKKTEEPKKGILSWFGGAR